MSTTVKCPECNSPLELPDAIPTGKRLQCPDCGSAFSPPGEADRAAGLKTEPMRPEGRVPAGSGAATSRRRPSRREEDFGEDTPPRRSGGGSAVLIAAVVVIVLLALGVGGAVLLFVGRAVEMRDDQAEMMAANVGPPPGAMMGPGGGGMMMGGPVAMPPGVGGMGGPGMGLKVGDAAPEIVGEDIDGKPMKLSDFQGKVVVLDFWGDWCPFCKPAYTYQNHLINRMKGEPFVLLGVNCDQTREQAQLVVKTQKIGWRSWYDGGGQMMGGPIFSNYGIIAVPTTFIIDKKGIIQQRLDQAPGEFQFDQEVDRVMALSENRPANAPTRWFPGSTAFSQLGDEVAIGAYLMRPPTDYVLEKLPPEAKRETYRWKGPPRKDGSVPVIEVSLAAGPPGGQEAGRTAGNRPAKHPAGRLAGVELPRGRARRREGDHLHSARWTVTDWSEQDQGGWLPVCSRGWRHPGPHRDPRQHPGLRGAGCGSADLPAGAGEMKWRIIRRPMLWAGGWLVLVRWSFLLLVVLAPPRRGYPGDPADINAGGARPAGGRAVIRDNRNRGAEVDMRRIEPASGYASTSFTTSPNTSVRRKSRPWKRYVSRLWSMPRQCSIVACRSWTWTGSLTML